MDPNTAAFTCIAEGLPVPSISWFMEQGHEVMEISSSDSNFIISTTTGIIENQAMSTLTITSVRPALATTYICKATNVVNEATQEAILTVHSKSGKMISYFSRVNFFIIMIKLPFLG